MIERPLYIELEGTFQRTAAFWVRGATMDAHRSDDSFAILGTAGFDVDMKSLGATSIWLVIAQNTQYGDVKVNLSHGRPISKPAGIFNFTHRDTHSLSHGLRSDSEVV